MRSRPPSRSFLALAAIAFGPPMFVLCAFLAPILIFAVADSRSTSGFSAELPDVVILILLGILPFGAAIAFSMLATTFERLLPRALTLYAGLNIAALAIAFIISASIAGTSMAVAEGAASGWSLKAQELQFALRLLIPMQVLVVPWTAICSLISIRLSRPSPSVPSSAGSTGAA